MYVYMGTSLPCFQGKNHHTYLYMPTYNTHVQIHIHSCVCSVFFLCIFCVCVYACINTYVYTCWCSCMYVGFFFFYLNKGCNDRSHGVAVMLFIHILKLLLHLIVCLLKIPWIVNACVRLVFECSLVCRVAYVCKHRNYTIQNIYVDWFSAFCGSVWHTVNTFFIQSCISAMTHVDTYKDTTTGKKRVHEWLFFELKQTQQKKSMTTMGLNDTRPCQNNTKTYFHGGRRQPALLCWKQNCSSTYCTCGNKSRCTHTWGGPLMPPKLWYLLVICSMSSLMYESLEALRICIPERQDQHVWLQPVDLSSFAIRKCTRIVPGTESAAAGILGSQQWPQWS